MVQAPRAVPEDEAKRPADPQDRGRSNEALGREDNQEEDKPSVIRRHPFWTVIIVLAVIALAVGATSI